MSHKNVAKKLNERNKLEQERECGAEKRWYEDYEVERKEKIPARDSRKQRINFAITLKRILSKQQLSKLIKLVLKNFLGKR